MDCLHRGFIMKTYTRLWEKLISYDNLLLAYENAKKHKTANPVVEEFSEDLQKNLIMLMHELWTKTYKPKPLITFTLRDPKTRTICKSNFRDRVIHHALVNILQPIFEPRFIYDSFASRIGKGTLAALQRYMQFLRKVTHNGKLTNDARHANYVVGYSLKCDIKHYFETVDHEILLNIMKKHIKDENIIWLIKVILNHYDSGTSGRGMPLGNWTSQFFANVYLNELDHYVKHVLKAKYYIRYVDDFVLLHRSKRVLVEYELCILSFLNGLKIELHPHKCKIIPLSRGVSFLGFRVFYNHTLVRERNIRKIKAKLDSLLDDYEMGLVSYYGVWAVWRGWYAYSIHGNTYFLCKRLEETLKQELMERTALRPPPEYLYYLL